MYRTVIVLAVLAFASIALADDKNITAKLDGTYSIISGEKNGQMMPTQELEGATIVFKNGTIVGTHKDKREIFSGTFTIDAAEKPFKIAMTNTSPKAQTKKAFGIIAVNGDTISLCYNLPGGAVPTEFRTQEKQHCFVLKRINR